MVWTVPPSGTAGTADVHCFKSTLEAQTALLIAALALAPLCGAQSPQPTIVIKFSHVVAPDTPKGKGAEYFSKLVRERTRGRVRVEVYPNSQLYKDKEELEALQLGSVQMLAPSASKFGPIGVKEFEAFDLPYLFDSYEAVHRVTHGPIGASMLEHLKPYGMAGLAFWDNGFKEFTANKPLRAAQDFKGLKLRVKSSKVLEAQMRAVGAIPQVLAFSELYQALQTGLVDGAENTPTNIYTQKLHEVQKYMLMSRHGFDAYVVVVNGKFWDSLAPDVRGDLEQALNETTRYVEAISAGDEQASIEAIRRSGRIQIIEMTADQRAALKKAMQPVYRQMQSRIGRDVVESIYAAATSDQKQPDAAPVLPAAVR
jgi:C4-dicarboxylate-binding protein DctP